MATIPDQVREPIDRRRLITSSVSSLLIFLLCLFVPAGTWEWYRGWVFFVVLRCSLPSHAAFAARPYQEKENSAGILIIFFKK
jgi:hypothetical protein